jgi:RNA-directed DNA polymerase
VSEPKPKSFEISKWAVWEAYRRVKANKGAAGVDEQSVAEFERDLKGNLYKLWNRLSSGSYIVYCKDSTRRGSYEHERFDFLGYTFRPRLSRNKSGGQFVNFLPAAGDDASKRMRREVRRWRLHLRPDKTLTDLARIFNPIIQGWINYYGRFYRSVLKKVLRRINTYLVRWAQGKYKRLRRCPAKARRFLVDVFRRQPDLFAHWRFGTRPDGWTMGAR